MAKAPKQQTLNLQGGNRPQISSKRANRMVNKVCLLIIQKEKPTN